MNLHDFEAQSSGVHTGLTQWLVALPVLTPTRFPAHLTRAKAVVSSIHACARQIDLPISVRVIDGIRYVCRYPDEPELEGKPW